MKTPSHKKKTSVHFSSKTDQWETPQDFFNSVQVEFKLNLDVCATNENHKLWDWFTKIDDGLSQDWKGWRCWMNPPYGREISKWVEKAATGGASLVVALLPARTDTRWFHDFIYQKKDVEVRFLKGRLKFGDSKNSAPFPSMLVIFYLPTPRVKKNT